ncbi:MAG: hypothetical protein Phog2KO_47020 [Phototrophicaceae bacterium]
MTGTSLRNLLWHYKSQVIAVILWIIAGLSANAYMQLNNLTSIEFIVEMNDMLSNTWYGPLIYILLYFLRPLTFFPGTPLTMLAGYEFGVFWGFIYALIGGLVSVWIPYAMGRWFSDEAQLKSLTEQEGNRMGSIIKTLRDNPFQTTLTTRFLYLPYDLVNFVAGSLHIPLFPFITATVLGNLINVFIMVTIGASIGSSFTEGKFTFNPTLLLVSVLVWLISYVITRYLKQNSKEQLA